MRSRRALAAALLTLVTAGCTRATGPREIVIVARGMTFVLASDPDSPNPLIRMRPGEQIELTLRNEAPGLMHDFRIPSWKVATEQIRSGQSARARFTVPGEVGRYEYHCGPHGMMMHGFIEVAAD